MHPIIYDTLAQGWLIPLDFIVHRQVMSALSFGFGDARSLHASYPQFDDMVYARPKVNF